MKALPFFTQEFTVRSGVTETIKATLVPLDKKDAAATNPVAFSPQPDANGWISLFNGKDLTGWKTHPEDHAKWEVKDRILIGSGPGSRSSVQPTR